MNSPLAGALAGLAATAAMTIAMTALHGRLPARQRYPLPPALITARLGGDSAPQSLALHFAYGAATGALFAALPRSWHHAPGGAAFGLAVWAGSYLGWLPALGILKPATRHPKKRIALMLAAHVVWGSVLGPVTKRLTASIRKS